jgi:hypothetical protein
MNSMNLAILNGRFELISFILFLCPVFGAFCVNAQVPTPTPQELNEIRVRANAGEARSEHDLAELYKWGQGVQQDYAEALKWYLKAAEQGDADSELNLGYLYQTGSGIKKNEKEAAKWLEKAAEQGIREAEFSIGSAYLYGKGLRKDQIAAAHWFEKAAEQGDGDAMMALGSMRWLGQGLSRDLVIAYMWLTLSEKFGSVETRLRANPFVVDVPSTRHDLMRVMSESEVSEGKELADEWISKHPQLTPANLKK